MAPFEWPIHELTLVIQRKLKYPRMISSSSITSARRCCTAFALSIPIFIGALL